jgi:hypothetical protein
MCKKTIADMTEAWHSQHRISDIPQGAEAWCKEVGICFFHVSSPEKVKAALDEIKDMPLIAHMVQDIRDAITALLWSTTISEKDKETFRHIMPHVLLAVGALQKTSEFLGSNGLQRDLTIEPPDEENDKMHD